MLEEMGVGQGKGPKDRVEKPEETDRLNFKHLNTEIQKYSHRHPDRNMPSAILNHTWTTGLKRIQT